MFEKIEGWKPPEPTVQNNSHILTTDERYAVNEVCRQVLHAWESENKPCDLVDLVTMLTQGAARACKRVRELAGPPAA